MGADQGFSAWAGSARTTSSGLNMTGILARLMHERRCLATSARSSVTLKKNRSATVPLIVGVPAPLDARCSR